MSLKRRITRLERALGNQPCTCPDSADRSWPSHQPNPNCSRCGGNRLIYPLTEHPREAEPLIRQALPLLAKAYGGNDCGDLSKLSNQELLQLKNALTAAQQNGN